MNLKQNGCQIQILHRNLCLNAKFWVNKTCQAIFTAVWKLPFSEIFIWLLHIKMNLGEKSFPQICFHMESPYNSWKIWWFLNSYKKSLLGPNNLKICVPPWNFMQNPNLASILFLVQRLPQASFWCREPTLRISI